jgi:hypothetical protein
MKSMCILFCRASFLVLLVGTSAVFCTDAPQVQENSPHSQVSFSAEVDKFEHAVPLPDCARSLLARDGHVLNVLKYEQLLPEQLPSDWFTATETELGRSNEKYLVVMGEGMMRGANINPFWVFRGLSNSCNLVLSVGALDLEILKTRTHNLHDIEATAVFAGRVHQIRYEFDGNEYQVGERSSQPIGEEHPPRNLSGFETHKPLIQDLGQTPEPILDEARAWLWHQWWLEKPSCLKVTLHSKEGDETTTTYFVRKAAGNLQMVIQKHQILVDRVPHSGDRHPIVDDEMIVAADVERRWALQNNPNRETEVPEGQDVPPDSYELYFNDELGENVFIL